MDRFAGTWMMAAVLLATNARGQQRAPSPQAGASDAVGAAAGTGAAALPDAPGTAPAQTVSGTSLPGQNGGAGSSPSGGLVPCPAAGSGVSSASPGSAGAGAGSAGAAAALQAPCVTRENPYRRFLNTTAPSPLTPRQKGVLAFKNLVDPFNLLTVFGNSAVTIAADSHTAYGPGWRGFGRNAGYSLAQDGTGEFLGTFAVCSIFHEDPHYHRLPDASPLRRAAHAISRTVVAQHDDGRLMPNYENLIVYPASAEISNLYVPGVHGDPASTVERILTGLATDPIGNLITEFLPDVAKRVHIRIVFVQQIINEVASGQQM